MGFALGFPPVYRSPVPPQCRLLCGFPGYRPSFLERARQSLPHHFRKFLFIAGLSLFGRALVSPGDPVFFWFAVAPLVFSSQSFPPPVFHLIFFGAVGWFPWSLFLRTVGHNPNDSVDRFFPYLLAPQGSDFYLPDAQPSLEATGRFSLQMSRKKPTSFKGKTHCSFREKTPPTVHQSPLFVLFLERSVFLLLPYAPLADGDFLLPHIPIFSGEGSPLSGTV